MGGLQRMVVLALFGAACSYERPLLAGADAGDGADAAVVDAAVVDAVGDLDAAGACALDDECASRVCENGGCLPEVAVRYVATIGDDTAPCTLAAPCATVAAAIARRPIGGDAFVSISPGGYRGTVTLDDRASDPPYDVYLIGSGPVGPTIYATDDGSNADGIELVHGRAVVRNLAVQGAMSNANSDAIWCGPGTTLAVSDVVAGPSRSDGIECRDCAVQVAGSQLRDNDGYGLNVTGTGTGQVVVTATVIDGNGQGGLALAATDCTVASSQISRNGAASDAPVAAVVACGDVVLDGNTFAGNVAPRARQASELRCVAATATLRNNLFAGTQTPLVDGCSHSYSLFYPAPAPAGTGNLGLAPRFVSATDFHLSADSPAVNAGAPSPPPTAGVDIDGQPRVSGGRVDVGADELR
ncbi:MAG: choice-of-anchor Q domain-containing protein [Kofleriaceae bacterium]